MGFCRATLSGKVSSDPVNRVTGDNTSVTRLEVLTGQGVAVAVACWGNLAESAKGLKLGDMVLVSGTLQTSSYKTNTGQPRKDFELKAGELFLLGQEPRNLNPQTRAVSTNQPSSRPSQVEKDEDLSDVFSEDDVPF